MYLSAGLKVENNIYLVECLSRCLISIHIPSGKTKIEANLPWRYTEKKIGLQSLKKYIFIYSPVIDHLLVYDCLKQQIKTIELQEITIDTAEFYFSNILVEKDGFIVLPFKDKEIKRYGIDGKLRFKDSRWCSVVAEELGCNETLFGNIRMDSACIAGNQLFFSLIYGNKNYLCRYELDKKEQSCKIIYCSEDIAIRGVYAYPNMVLFRRIFADKTEFISIALNSDEQRIIKVDYPSTFEKDIYGDIHHLKASFKNNILSIERNSLNSFREIYKFEQSDLYVANGILFNRLRNEIMMPDLNHTRKFSIEKIVKEIKNCSVYQEGCRKLFGDKCICEGRYTLHNLIGYFTEFSPVMIEKKSVKNIGKFIWQTI